MLPFPAAMPGGLPLANPEPHCAGAEHLQGPKPSPRDTDGFPHKNLHERAESSGDERVPAVIPEAEEQHPWLGLTYRPGWLQAVIKLSDSTDSSFVRKNILIFCNKNSYFPFSSSEGRNPASPCITDSYKSWQILSSIAADNYCL